MIVANHRGVKDGITDGHAYVCTCVGGIACVLISQPKV